MIKQINPIYLLAFVLALIALGIDHYYPNERYSTFIPLISALAGSAIGVIGGYGYNRRIKLEDQYLAINLRKFETLNKLWNEMGQLVLAIKNTPDFYKRWSGKEDKLLLEIDGLILKVDGPYFQVDFLMSKELGSLVEYFGKHLIQANLFGGEHSMKPMSEPMYRKFILTLDNHLSLMMKLIRIECNEEALGNLMYGRFSGYEISIKNWTDRRDHLLKAHKNEFESIQESIKKSDENVEKEIVY